MELVLPDIETFASARIETERPMTDDEFWCYCSCLPDNLRAEREPNGEIIIMPPAGWGSSNWNAHITIQLGNWAIRDGRGQISDSNTNFILPNRAARGPDAAWISNTRLATLTREQKRRFLPLCPEFVVELKSPSDRLTRLKAKMEEWIENGAQLAWLIDPDTRTVYVYRPGKGPEELKDADSIAGEGPVAGFVLDLGPIWRGL
jgi:Uma2 family endonuclease